MSVLTSLARVHAYELGRAVPIATRRHVHISDRPLVFVPLSMAGEANAPLACLVGSTPESPTMLVVPQPRNRDLRFRFAESLADVVLAYVDSFTVSMEPDHDQNVFTDAPQLVVANPSAAAFTRLLGRSTRLRRTDGPYPVAPSVPLLGRWLTYFAEQTERPGSSAMLVMTTVLAAHWATGQSPIEDLNLAALVGWIDPWDGLTGFEAAAEAGARYAGYTMLRLPGAVAQVFADWLETHYPLRKEKVLNRVRESHEGKLNDPEFFRRMRGHGAHAEQVRELFHLVASRLGLERERYPELDTSRFRRPGSAEQPSLFGP
mgnify:CR=1 FL=1